MQFNSLPNIPETLLDTLDRLDYREMTPIQVQTIPLILQGKDLLAQSKTGSGKTLAFALPEIMRVNPQSTEPEVLIVTPTRELAEQVAHTFRDIATHIPNLKVLTLYGGVPLRPQAGALSKGTHILIGTPGRIRDHLSKETLKLDTIRRLILDEADKMLDMGFYDDILSISSQMSTLRQTLLFSATFPKKVEDLAKSVLNDPDTVKIETLLETSKIEETVYETTDKFQTLQELLHTYEPKSALIFCNTKEAVAGLTEKLIALGHSTIDLQGDLDQKQRREALIQFSNGSARLLVATDVASRGLDIKEIAMVINYDLPSSEETYTHRIGRTGRADATGKALSLFTSEEHKKCTDIAKSAHRGDTSRLNKKSDLLLVSEMQTLVINGGKKSKLRKGDILGTFCKEIGVNASLIGQIYINEQFSYIALHQTIVDKVLKAMQTIKIKKRKYRAWVL